MVPAPTTTVPLSGSQEFSLPSPPDLTSPKICPDLNPTPDLNPPASDLLQAALGKAHALPALRGLCGLGLCSPVIFLPAALKASST